MRRQKKYIEHLQDKMIELQCQYLSQMRTLVLGYLGTFTQKITRHLTGSVLQLAALAQYQHAAWLVQKSQENALKS